MRGCRAAAHAKGFQLSVAIVLLLLSACALSPASGYGADSNVDGYGGKDDISEGMKTGADDSAVGYVFRFCDSCGYMTFTGSSSNDAIFWGCWLVWELNSHALDAIDPRKPVEGVGNGRHKAMVKG